MPHSLIKLGYLGLDGITKDKLTLGLGYYDRSFTLENSSCTAAEAESCTNTSGTLAGLEIENIMTQNSENQLQLDAYDNEQTLLMRR